MLIQSDGEYCDVAELVRERAEKAARNRARWPEFAALVDEYRRVFGDIRVIRIVDL